MTAKPFATRRYLAVFLPLLSSERVLRACAAPRDTGFVLVEKVRSADRCAAADAHALALGILPGLTLAEARARVPALIAVDHDPNADQALLEWLADGCERYTPSVMVDPPQGLILDITGCTTGFAGGEAGLARDLAARLERQGLSLHLAFAATPDAAAALARHGMREGEVEALPVTALRVDPEIHLALRRAGFRTVADLSGRPAAPLAARFGTDIPDLLARLLDGRDVCITPHRSPPVVQVEHRCAEPIVHSDTALAVLDRLAGEAAVQLGQRDCGGRRFEATLFRADGQVARLTFQTSAPTRDPKVLARLFRERIGALSDPLDPGFGYDLIRLAIPVVEPLTAQQLRLEGGTVADTELAALVDRLTVRLGHGQVRRLRPGNSYLPEQAAFELPIAEAMTSGDWPIREPGEPPLRPLHLFDPPERIEVMAEVPDGPPRRFRWRRAQHDVTRYEGPERIAAEWWRRKDGRGLTRDYYRVENHQGRRFWVFRHGLYVSEKASPSWFLHGLFA